MAIVANVRRKSVFMFPPRPFGLKFVRISVPAMPVIGLTIEKGRPFWSLPHTRYDPQSLTDWERHALVSTNPGWFGSTRVADCKLLPDNALRNSQTGFECRQL